MAKKKKQPKISADSKKLIKEYHEADQLLTNRIQDKRYGFDTYDKLFNTYLDPAKWPYSVKLATPRGFTGIFNKTTRMIGGRFTGRIEGVEQGDEAGARIASEHFKWSVKRFNDHSDMPIESIIALADSNTRLYGAGFLRAYWKTEKKWKRNPKTGKKELKTVYDNWWVEVVNNRDLMLQPGRETVANSDYVIHRRYASLESLERIQEDGAGFDEKVMATLKEAKTGLGKDHNYIPVVKLIKGQDWEDERFEICTTYYRDKWVTWCPTQGSKGSQKTALVLRTIDNPYSHGEIPIVPIVYIPSQEDVYGMSELQPVTALLKILSALQSQFIELVNKELYPPTLVSANEVRMDTFKYRPKAFWLVNDPSRVAVLDQKSSQSLATFSEAYKMMVTELLEALGETGSGVSQADLLGGDKTATEVRDRAFLRNSRDNFNKIMLSAALKRLMYLLFEMLRDGRFSSKDTVIKVVGKEALEYFDKQGFSTWGIDEYGYQLVYETAQALAQDEIMSAEAEDSKVNLFDIAYDILLAQGALDQFAVPASPVTTAKGLVAKLELGDEDDLGYLHVNPDEDYLGDYNFLPDIEALGMPDTDRDYSARSQWYEQARAVEEKGLLQRDGFQLKHKDILSKLGDLAKIKEADQYFEKAEVPKPQGGIDETFQGGAGGQEVGGGQQGVPPVGPVPGSPSAPPASAGPGLPQTQ